ncbi:MAG TPA: hypothetical protein VFJ58_28940 [Armatimonadota bacterium]|nr:hypothetical protein [Armatimonadota bacterium]
MTTEIADLFPSSFQDSELGPIPEGWSLGTIAEIARKGGSAVNPKNMIETTPYIGLEHMPRCSIALSEWGSAGGVVSNKFRYSAGDILFGKLRPYFHKVGVAPNDGLCSTDILVIVPRMAEWYGLTLGHLSSNEFIANADAASEGTKMPRTNWETMSRYPVVLPPTHLAKAYSDIALACTQAIAASIHQSRTLAAIRDALLPKLLSGEIRVSAAEEAVAAA